MAAHDPQPTPPATDLQAMLARLRGMAELPRLPESPPPSDLIPTWDAGAEMVPLAQPVTAEVPIPPGQTLVPDTLLPDPTTIPMALPVLAPPVISEEAVAPERVPPVVLSPCPACQAARVPGQSYCGDCGYIFPEGEPVPSSEPPTLVLSRAAALLLRERYEIGERICKRDGTERFRALDHGTEGEPAAVVVVRVEVVPPVEAVVAVESVEDAPVESAGGEEVLPTFDLSPPSVAAVAEAVMLPPSWPNPVWEADLLEKAAHPALPRILDRFTEQSFDYLILEVPAGQTLWDAWDDPEATFAQRFTWLRQTAETLRALHRAGAIIEGLRPDAVVVTPEGTIRFTDLSGLLPLPVPPDALIRATHYTAPELVFSPAQADARADLYHFGALLFSLHVGRELVEMDFERPGVPKDFFPIYPEVHPLFGRLMVKTFCREPAQRFPTDEAAKEDATGFTELLHALDTCGRMLDRVRLEIAAWTTTGMVRTGNEDAFAVLHGVEAREDELTDTALVILCDGMGGYEAGEVAARMAVQGLRATLLKQQPFSSLLGQTEDETQPELDVEVCRWQIDTALKEANRAIYNAARSGTGRRGMGCTAEVVYVHGRHLLAGHVGDSRVYHLHQGRLTQLTRDQTLVNRLVELGQLTPEEAATHPRRSELQQAIGGHPSIEVDLHHRVLKAGDFVVVCSDGLSNHVLPKTLQEMLLTSGSAEVAARRLVNLVNLEGATDNATIVVLRVM